ncbi:hypothetical protein K438DRAFT_1775509 [Mycena galopus ATCC 62051]|nr:hypothetical protein K438DRAFT_1775509 [Mycena galopus ATCC 62051]
MFGQGFKQKYNRNWVWEEGYRDRVLQQRIVPYARHAGVTAWRLRLYSGAGSKGPKKPREVGAPGEHKEAECGLQCSYCLNILAEGVSGSPSGNGEGYEQVSPEAKIDAYRSHVPYTNFRFRSGLLKVVIWPAVTWPQMPSPLCQAMERSGSSFVTTGVKLREARLVPISQAPGHLG